MQDICKWRYDIFPKLTTEMLSFEIKRIFGRFNGRRGNTKTKRKVLIKAGVRTNDGT